ncbi:MAG: rRNA maturation RNase YbeY [Candidatus Niyogibacteria bacterium]|nr:rRNA maturation RNase YbeY [Candidatus Niyogibacteria bacterium]
MVKNLTRLKIPAISWQKIKNKILSKDYELSLVFVSDKEMARINLKYRGATGPTDILAFLLAKNSGEIFIDLPFASRKAGFLKKNIKERVLFLYIHALLHLKGFKHGTLHQSKIMLKHEKKWLKILS